MMTKCKPNTFVKQSYFPSLCSMPNCFALCLMISKSKYQKTTRLNDDFGVLAYGVAFLSCAESRD